MKAPPPWAQQMVIILLVKAPETHDGIYLLFQNDEPN